MAEEQQLFIALYTDEDVTSELAPVLRARGFMAQSVAEAGLLHGDDVDHLGMVQIRANLLDSLAALVCKKRP